ncbi:Origin recognition complex, subunit 6 [Niveomyces insectorum RCEF 264]|uniref:Origin recognition complex, subunit 6 n=1 Tax=Niveomyces insectorum RCEF 264 TaxID=1081102 RepID=A0A167NQN4_9HYPO|nr:Origin recognition complex, subunit 6 [Niveomyces insectorum RCEF 264]
MAYSRARRYVTVHGASELFVPADCSNYLPIANTLKFMISKTFSLYAYYFHSIHDKMNRPTDQALHSLLPTHNGAFPPQLADLASSLLAQSRHRASTLKADEEIARPYACAHIACDRLKTVLNLPPFEPHPPIQPRLYKRLYTHLNTILQPAPGRAAATATATEPASPAGGTGFRNSPAKQTPRSQQRGRRAADGDNITEAAAASPTPARTGRTIGAKTPTRPRSARSRPAAAAPSSTPFPPWLRPTLRFVCAELGYPQLAPTIAAGLATIHQEARFAGKRAKGGSGGGGGGDDDETLAAWVEAHLAALTAALYFYSVASWRDGAGGHSSSSNANNGGAAPLEEKQFQADEKAILAAFGQVRQKVHVGRSNDDDDGEEEDKDDEAENTAFWIGWQGLRRRAFRDALVMVSDQQWLQSDWYRDIPNLRTRGDRDGGDQGNSDQDGDDDDNDNGEEEDNEDGDAVDSIPTHVWRADSMFQARYDFLSAAKQREYEAWQTAMLARIDQVERQQATHSPMDLEA